jgi:O-antigen ligase
VILIKRKLQWAHWMRGNAWLIVFFLYCGVSIIWSDFQGVAFKRWIRALGAVTVVLVILSETDPIEAIAAIVRRCALILIPFSVALIKYYREYAVVYDWWDGQEVLIGVTTDKNALGRLCLIVGLFAVWEVIAMRQKRRVSTGTLNGVVSIGVFIAAMWLLLVSKSATSLAAFLVGCCVLFLLGLPAVAKRARYLGTLIMVGAGVAVVLNLWFNLIELAITGLGRNTTLTTRTVIWPVLLATETNPLVGVGYDSFWLGERLQDFVRLYRVTSAHNGYLDVYLELGMVGLFLFAGFLLTVFLKGKRSLAKDVVYGRLRLAVLAVYILYNVTESGYKATNLIFFLLLLIAIEIPAVPRLRRPDAGAVGEALNVTTKQNVTRYAVTRRHSCAEG